MKVCKECGKEYKEGNYSFHTKYCLDKCRESVIKKPKYTIRNEEHLRLCSYCGEKYIQSRYACNTKYCSTECRESMKKEYGKLKRAKALIKKQNGTASIICKDVILAEKYIKYKNGATKRNYEFNLSRTEFDSFYQKRCYYCGDVISIIGIDRFDNTKGYSIENCVPCCTICNWMKLNKTESFFIAKCNQIIDNYKIKIKLK